jgi:uncharacterized protein (TIGR03435 family)
MSFKPMFVLLIIVAVAGIAAQEPDRPPAFEVASMRPSRAGTESRVEVTPNGYRAVNVPLLRLMIEAYVPGAGSKAPFYEMNRVMGAPEWTKAEDFDVEARVSEADRTQWQKPPAQKVMLRAMLQALLSERCKLAVHREMRELPIYSLQVAKNGPKLKDAETADPAELERKHPGGIALPEGGVVLQGRQMSFFGTPMSTLAEMLSVPAGRPVEDRTGLTGRYDFALQLRDSNPPTGEAGTSPEPALSIFTALQEQLGLRLESAKGQVEMLVIDHVERPTEN